MIFPWHPAQIQYHEVEAYATSTQYFHEVDYSATY
jgi:hypothetical protein